MDQISIVGVDQFCIVGNIKGHYNAIRGLIFELNTVVRFTVDLRNPSISQENRQITQQLLRQGRDILYDLKPSGGIDDSDVFKREFEAALVTIETYLWAKLPK